LLDKRRNAGARVQQRLPLSHRLTRAPEADSDLGNAVVGRIAPGSLDIEKRKRGLSEVGTFGRHKTILILKGTRRHLYRKENIP
jgi:hypothetical protein